MRSDSRAALVTHEGIYKWVAKKALSPLLLIKHCPNGYAANETLCLARASWIAKGLGKRIEQSYVELGRRPIARLARIRLSRSFSPSPFLLTLWFRIAGKGCLGCWITAGGQKQNFEGVVDGMGWKALKNSDGARLNRSTE